MFLWSGQTARGLDVKKSGLTLQVPVNALLDNAGSLEEAVEEAKWRATLAYSTLKVKVWA